MKIPGKVLLLILMIHAGTCAISQKTNYPYPVHYFLLNQDGQPIKIAFMDVQPVKPNGRAVLLFHGKNFNGFYWKSVIDALSKEGYRVIVPDQVGWGKSSKPNMKYSFKILAGNNISLLDSLGIKKVDVIGHSMGGMLATRFTLLYPEMVSKLVLEDPLGLEDYKQFVPLQPIETLYKKELKANYASYKKYMQSYFPVWKPEYEALVKVQAEPLKQKDFPSIAYVNALTWQMIYDQPVLYEFKDIKVPVLIVVGDKDRTILGKELLSKEQIATHGNFPELANTAAAPMKKGKVIIIPGAGHIPHIQTSELFNKDVIDFLR